MNTKVFRFIVNRALSSLHGGSLEFTITVPVMYLEMKERRMKRKIMKMFMMMRKLNYLKKRKKKKHKLKTFQYFLDYTPGSLDYWAFVIKRINKLLTNSQIWFTFGHYHLLIKKNTTVASILESRL